MNRLKERRLELGLSQPDVVKMLRDSCPAMDVSLYSKIENGHCLPNACTLTALERALQAAREILFEPAELAAMPDVGAVSSAPATPMTVTLSGLIPFGRRNAISREALAAKLRMSDRQMRQAVEDARSEGLIILCECNGRGYYQSNDVAEMRFQYRQDTNRAMSILRRRKPLRDALVKAGCNV